MDERPDEIEDHIRQQRDELRDNFNELGSKVKDTFDWRAQFEDKTGLMLGVAFGGGLLLSALFRGRSGRMVNSGGHPTAYVPTQTETRRDTGRGSETLEHMKSALVAAAVTRVGTYIEELLPGFKSEYEKAGGRPAPNASDTVH
jgi:hypothetical protein